MSEISEATHLRTLSIGIAMTAAEKGITDIAPVLQNAQAIFGVLSGITAPMPESFKPDFSGLVQTVSAQGASEPEITPVEVDPRPTATQLGAKPARKPRGPNKVKAAKKASGKKRGRPAKVAETEAEKDGPITNGAGEPHVEAPAAEPPQLAA